MSLYHVPVLVKEVALGLQVAPGKQFIDATVGGGGHAREIVMRGGTLLGIDTDSEALEAAREELAHTQSGPGNTENWKIVEGNFKDIGQIAKENGFSAVDGILFDLGVSSHQLDTPERGFSYRFGDAPLDLRLDQHKGSGASEYLKKVSENELYENLAKYSEEEHSRAIASAIVRSRRLKAITTTGDLYKIIEKQVGTREAKSVASRIFQALRIIVNDELVALREGLSGAKVLLKSGGRLAVISFHSLEDRIVKKFMRTDGWKVITKKPIVAGESEYMQNKRSRSAKLRIAEKL